MFGKKGKRWAGYAIIFLKNSDGQAISACDKCLRVMDPVDNPLARSSLANACQRGTNCLPIICMTCTTILTK